MYSVFYKCINDSAAMMGQCRFAAFTCSLIDTERVGTLYYSLRKFYIFITLQHIFLYRDILGRILYYQHSVGNSIGYKI